MTSSSSFFTRQSKFRTFSVSAQLLFSIHLHVHVVATGSDTTIYVARDILNNALIELCKWEKNANIFNAFIEATCNLAFPSRIKKWMYSDFPSIL